VNRETKRMLQKQGAINADGTAVRETRSPVARDPKEPRVTPMVFISQVRAELKKVLWPTRAEVKTYTSVVLFTLLLMTLLTFSFDWIFSKGVLSLYSR
jgi:preprotein translocase subunit SecE